MKRSENAIAIYDTLYFNPNETEAEQTHLRVANCIGEDDEQIKTFQNLLDTNTFRPNSPCLINARSKEEACKLQPHDNNLVACFVVKLEDNMDSIMNLWSTCAKVYAGGGGTGFPISNLREKNAPITAGGVASGPIEYMKVVQRISDTVKSGGKSRRAANFASAVYTHPDIIDLINCKNNYDFSAINISISVDDWFMNQVDKGNWSQEVKLVSPNGKTVVNTITVGKIWNEIVDNAWATGDPGLLFVDTVNENNPLPSEGAIEACNPCLPGWVPVLTSNGYKHFIDVKNEIVIEGKTQQCSDVFKTRKDTEVYEMELQNGISLFATPDHKITTQNGDVELHNLKYLDKVKVDYTPIEFELDNKEEEEGFIAGLLFSEGSIWCDNNHNKNQANFSLGIEEFNYENHFTNLIQKHLQNNSLQFKPHYQSPETCRILSICRNDDMSKLIKLFKSTNKDEFDLISKSISYQIGFTNAMISCDGHVLNTNRTKMVNINQSGSRGNRILRQMQLVLCSLGIYSNFTLCNKSKNNRGFNEKESWRLEIIDIKSFNKYFNLYSDTKQKNIEDAINSYGPYKDVRIKTLKSYQKIKDIRRFNNTDVYDIKVPKTQHFVACGVVVHNCGEVPLPGNSSCDLGSINLTKFVFMNGFNHDLFKECIGDCVEFLDLIIDKTSFPNTDIEEMMKKTRPIGLGVMGLSDVFYKLKIRYGNEESISIFKEICSTLTTTAFEKSIDLAEEKGSIEFQNDDKEHFRKLLKEKYNISEQYLNKFDKVGIRNSNVSCIAPTGSISITAECSYAFEPNMALVWQKVLTDRDKTLTFVDHNFLEACSDLGMIINDEKINEIINNSGSIQSLDYPDEIKEVFVTAHDLSWRDKIKMQAAAQKHMSLAISSTCNLKNEATKSDVAEAYILAWKSKLKGITVYRDGCKDSQPVSFGKVKDKDEIIIEPLKLPAKRVGNTIKLKSPNGTLYITGNKVNGKLVEVFLAMGKVGQLENLLINSYSKQISKSLQYHMPVNVVLEQMEDQGGFKFWFKLDEDKNISVGAESLLDAISKIIRYHFLEEEVDGHSPTETGKKQLNESYNICPQCGKRTLTYTSGCRSGMCMNPNCTHGLSCG